MTTWFYDFGDCVWWCVTSWWGHVPAQQDSSMVDRRQSEDRVGQSKTVHSRIYHHWPRSSSYAWPPEGSTVSQTRNQSFNMSPWGHFISNPYQSPKGGCGDGNRYGRHYDSEFWPEFLGFSSALKDKRMNILVSSWHYGTFLMLKI